MKSHEPLQILWMEEILHQLLYRWFKSLSPFRSIQSVSQLATSNLTPIKHLIYRWLKPSIFSFVHSEPLRFHPSTLPKSWRHCCCFSTSPSVACAAMSLPAARPLAHVRSAQNGRNEAKKLAKQRRMGEIHHKNTVILMGKMAEVHWKIVDCIECTYFTNIFFLNRCV